MFHSLFYVGCRANIDGRQCRRRCRPVCCRLNWFNRAVCRAWQLVWLLLFVVHVQIIFVVGDWNKSDVIAIMLLCKRRTFTDQDHSQHQDESRHIHRTISRDI